MKQYVMIIVLIFANANSLAMNDKKEKETLLPPRPQSMQITDEHPTAQEDSKKPREKCREKCKTCFLACALAMGVCTTPCYCCCDKK